MTSDRAAQALAERIARECHSHGGENVDWRSFDVKRCAEILAEYQNTDSNTTKVQGVACEIRHAMTLIKRKFDSAGGAFKVARTGVELGAMSWASNVDNGIHNAFLFLDELDAILAPTPPQEGSP